MAAVIFSPSRRLNATCWAVAILGLGASGLALAGIGADPRQALHSWLCAFVFLASIQTGALLLLMTGHVAGASWLIPLRRLLEAISGTLPLSLLLFVPIAMGAHLLYPWADPTHLEDAHVVHLLEHRRPWLNLPFFLGRAAFVLMLFACFSVLLPRLADRPSAARGLSAAGLPAVGIAFTFAVFDWLMSLMPVWFSAAYGLYVSVGGFLGAIALLVVLAAAADRRGLTEGFITGQHFYALGRLLLAFVILWAYIGFFQAFFIVYANKPEEITFFATRLSGAWRGVTFLLMGGHFAVPFLLLLSRSRKFRPNSLMAIGLWLLAMHFVDLYWLVLPVLSAQLLPHWVDLAALAAVLGSATALGLRLLSGKAGKALVPVTDAALLKGAHYRSL